MPASRRRERERARARARARASRRRWLGRCACRCPGTSTQSPLRTHLDRALARCVEQRLEVPAQRHVEARRFCQLSAGRFRRLGGKGGAHSASRVSSSRPGAVAKGVTRVACIVGVRAPPCLPTRARSIFRDGNRRRCIGESQSNRPPKSVSIFRDANNTCGIGNPQPHWTAPKLDTPLTSGAAREHW
eukprot:SAG25_NODE_1481_length_2936_cov_4.360014_4_plen_188_part_00